MDGPDVPVCTIRPLREGDSFEEVTALLHRAYARLGALGLNYTAVDQDVEVTRRRATRGTCLVAEREGRLVGTLAYHGPDGDSASPWFRRPDVVVLEQFAVEPSLQGLGIGGSLMEAAERAARASGATWAVGDTAEAARHLIALYEARGYAVVDRVRWPGKVYESVVLAKALR